MALPFKLVYSERYDLPLGVHIFPARKYRLVRQALLEQGIAEASDFVAPQRATDEDVLRVHTPEYVDRLKNDRLSYKEKLRLEVPYSKDLVEAFWMAAGGSILSGRLACENGMTVNVGGGFHHAFPDHGEGFCAIHDVAVAIRRLQADGAIRTAMVIDTDVHQGNGTAAIFEHDESVFTLSIHQENNYPHPKPPSNIDVNLPDGTGDRDYLARLESHLLRAFEQFQPDLAFYLAGADPYREDQLGGLSLSLDGLRKRDRLVFEAARDRSVPVAVTLAGGYARQVDDTVRIHVNMILTARDVALATARPGAR